MLFIPSIRFRVAPGHFKYSSANAEAWRPFYGALNGPAPPPSLYNIHTECRRPKRNGTPNEISFSCEIIVLFDN